MVNISKQNALLIVNPVAGRKKASKLINGIVDLLSENGYNTAVFATDRKGSAVEIVTKHAAQSQRIICCGGDGTLNEVFTALHTINLQIPVGYIPTGTTNDLASSLSIPKNPHKAVDVSVNGMVRKHDIGVFNKTLCFAYVASFGAFTKSSYATPQWLKNAVGHAAYVLYGVFSVAGIRSHELTAVADGQKLTGKFIYGSVSNSTVIGGLIKLPKEDVIFDDGKFEVLLIRTPKNLIELLRIVSSVLRRRYDDRYVHYFKASELSFSFKKDTAWTIDGEYAGSHESVCIENTESKAQVAVLPTHTK